MARKIRFEYPSTVYHVLAQGNQGRDIYADDRQRKVWLETFPEACEKTGGRAHAWVMMDNHYRQWLESPVSQAIGWVKRQVEPESQELKRLLE